MNKTRFKKNTMNQSSLLMYPLSIDLATQTELADVSSTINSSIETAVSEEKTAREADVEKLSSELSTKIDAQYVNDGFAKKADFDTLSDSVEEVSGEVDSLSSNFEALSDSFDGFSNSFDALSNIVEDLSGNVETAAAEVSEMKEDLTGVSNSIESISNSLSDVSNSVSAISDSIDGVSDSVEAVSNKVTEVSTSLSIDVGRVTVTENDGFEKGSLLGTIANSDLNNTHLESVVAGQYASNSSWCFPISTLITDLGYDLNTVINTLGNGTLSLFTNVIGCGNYANNAPQGMQLNDVKGYFYDDSALTSIPVYLYWDSNNNRASWCSTKDDPSTEKDSASIVMDFQAVLVDSHGDKVFRQPVVFWNDVGGTRQDAAFVTYLDYEAIPKKKTIGYDSIISSTYATKSELDSELSGFVDLTSNQNIRGVKSFSDIDASSISAGDIYIGSTSSRSALIGSESISYRFESKELLMSTNTGSTGGFSIISHDFNDDTNIAENDWAFPEVDPEKNLYTFASQEYVDDSISSNLSNYISGYVSKEELKMQLCSDLSGLDMNDGSKSIKDQLNSIVAVLSNLMTSL